jgi:hypothetical protein
MLAAEEAGRYGAPTVWAQAPGRRDIARGEPVRDGWLRFKVDDATYRQLAGDGLSAIVTVDRKAARFWASSSSTQPTVSRGEPTGCVSRGLGCRTSLPRQDVATGRLNWSSLGSLLDEQLPESSSQPRSLE